MKIFRSFAEAKGTMNPVVTTGSFDGVHIGHKTILNRLKMLAEKNNGESVLITFHPHPRKVLYPDTAGRDLKLINSQEEKLELLRKAGLDNLIIIEFTKEFSRVTSEEFVRDFLYRILKAKVVVAGFNHHFGFNQEGDYRHLWTWSKKYGFEAEEIPEQEVQHETVSSTRIRKAISEGYIQRANAYLDHYYMIMGRPDNRPFLTFPSFADFYRIPLTEECKILPATGVYAVSVSLNGAISKGMVLICQDKGKQPDVLIHFFEDQKKYPEHHVSILFHKMICGSINLQDPGASIRLERAKDEIAELIF
jgi:riboflavin kinase/FMN adenylyltransferase